MSTAPDDVKSLLFKLLMNASDFTANDTYKMVDLLLSSQATESQIASFLTAMKLLNLDQDASHIASAAKSMRNCCLKVPTHDCVDIVGTGGDGFDTFNVSTAASLVACGAGLKVAKHGNRASSSKCGSADVLEELGCNLNNIDPEKIPNMPFTFLFAQKFHPAMKHVAAVRKQLGVRTIFNLLGPLTNPARPKKMVVGVFKKELGYVVARALQIDGVQGMVVCGSLGLDEVAPTGDTHTWTFTSDPKTEIMLGTISPKDFGLGEHEMSSVVGGDRSYNAKVMNELVDGKYSKGHPILDFVLLNAAALLKVSGKAATYEEGVDLAVAAIESGNVRKALDSFREELK